MAAWGRDGRHSGDRPPHPVNRFPDFVRLLVQRLKTLCPAMGRRRIAQTLARAGLHLAASTVARIVAEPAPQTPPAGVPAPESPPAGAPPPPPSRPDVVRHGVKARRPDHVWHVDLTLVPTSGGLFIPWLPFAFLQCWPFCAWALVVTDQFSRTVVGFAVHPRQPTAQQVCADLDRFILTRGAAPRHLISDKGAQFDSAYYRGWCAARTPEIRPRYGAVGRKGSIAFVERVILSLKEECLRRIVVPMSLPDL